MEQDLSVERGVVSTESAATTAWQDRVSPGLLLRLDHKVSPGHTALIIIDMQNDFCSPGGFIDQHTAFDATGTEAIIGKIQTLREAARAQGVLTIHVKSHFGDEDLNAPMQERLVRMGVEPYCVPGTWGAQIVDRLKPASDEVQVIKHAYDGFHNTSLNDLLVDRGIRTVIVTGLATDNCVAATGKGAMYRGFYVILPSDTCVSGSPEQQDAALTIARHAYAQVCESDEVMGAWNG